MKTKTESIDDVLSKCLEGENVDALLRSLSAEESTLFYQLVESIRSQKKDTGEFDDLWKVDYIRRPPKITEFIEDPYWLGSVLLPSADRPGLFPTWKEVLSRDFDLDSRIHNLVITGSLGTGKTYVADIILLYRVVLARLLRNPQNFFGIGVGSKIFYVLLSLTKAVVQETAFGDLQNFMANCPFFLEECNFNPDSKYTNFRIPLGNGIIVTAGSKGWHIIGRNTMGVMLDEGNWRLESNPDTKAYQLYDEVRTRIQNRFQTMSGFLPAISILSSSAKDESSFTEKVIKDIEDSKDTQTQAVYRYAVYHIKKHTLKLGDRWFKVAHGLKNMEPLVLSGWYDIKGNPVAHGGITHETPPPGARVELVPMDYHAAFVRNCRVSLQSISGISTGGSHRLFPNTIDIDRCISLSESEGVLNPCKMDMIPVSQEDDKQVWDYLDHKKFIALRQSRYEPLRHPSALRFAHLDLATTSMAGVGICHFVGQKLVEGLILDGKPFAEYRLVVEYDFILTIVAGASKPISFEKIQTFFFWLRDVCNYRFGMVTADQFQSVQALQMLESRGFKTDNLSVDKNKAPYYAWRSAFEENRLRLYRQHQMMREAEELLDGPDKIDHPYPDGSKDTTDCACGAYFNAVTAKDKMLSMSSESAPTMYTDSILDPKTSEAPPISIPIVSEPRRVPVFKA